MSRHSNSYPEQYTGYRELCDSDRNIMASLQHEACEAHCEHCGLCIFEESPTKDEDGNICCVDCTPLE